MAASQFRLVTRSDFDGLVCGVLLKELDLIDEITFVHPKDMQDGKVAITGRDITTPHNGDSSPAWKLTRPPQMFETSLPSVFAVGDVRAGNVKRVASAVGEGSISIHLVQLALTDD